MPRYFIIFIVIGVVLIFSIVRIALRSSSHHFECPSCGKSFQVSFFKYFFTAHGLDGKCNMTCPSCGKTNFMTPLSGKK
ncbi:MAG: hypothetical protein FWF30_03300 [Coriobacteriia bacterium]|nr:hypothetical protein [Coriobacteriia bacterium]